MSDIAAGGGKQFIERGTVEYRQAVLALFCAGFATFALLYCVQPLLPELALAFSVSSASSSLALSVSTLGLAGGLLISGSLSESWGRKPVMVTALLLACALGLVTAVVQDWLVLLVLRALLGLALSGLPAVAMAYIGEEFEPGSLPVAMGLYIGGTALGGLLGRLLTAALGDWGGWSLALGGIAGLGLLASVLFVWLLPASRHFVAQPLRLSVLLGNFTAHLRNADLRVLFLLSFLLMGSFVALFNYIGFYLSGGPFRLSSTLIGLLFLVYLLGIWGSNAAGRQVVRRGAKPVLQGSLVLMLSGILLCLTPWLLVIVVGLAVFTTGFFAAHTVASGLVGQRAEQARGQASALYLCAYYLGSSALGYVMGWAWQYWGWSPLAMGLMLALLIGLVVTRRL